MAEANWKKNPNLVKGDFEHGADGVPDGWDRVAGQQREPLGGLVRWADEIGNPKNRVIRFTLDKNVAENEGVMYYSDLFPRRGRGQVPLPVPLALGRSRRPRSSSSATTRSPRALPGARSIAASKT